MKRTKLTITVISLALLLSILFNLTGCVTVQAANLMDGVTANKVNKLDDLEEQSASFTDFALRLFKATNEDGENVLISPLSVMCALSMTLNGAEGNTLAQMENVLGMQRDELNLYLYSYITSLPRGEKYKLIQANSIWFRDDDRFSVSPDFLQTNADYYGADIYKAPFDRQTLRDINNWVKLSTDGMIPKILDDIPDSAIMYLVNALAFEAEWKEVYKKTQVRDGKFTTEDGEVQSVKLMYAEENRYLEDENATGFIKYYSDRKYAFAAILPNEGVSVSEYLASIDGEALYSMLTNSQSTTVKTAIPKFEVKYDTEMSGILKEMGMSDAFNSILADFSGIGSSTRGNIYIGRVIHKTFIEVGEKGTRAGAATVVEMNDAAAEPSKPKEVILDRPFIYMLIDCENNVPFFIGTLMDAD
ncbi:MAG: serpin family protein [Clostridia bacterium]|nr:serpin family protein [Clostridia bacterium]